MTDRTDPAAYEQRTAEHAAQFDGARHLGDFDPSNEANALEDHDLTRARLFRHTRESNQQLRDVLEEHAFDANITRTAPKLDRWVEEVFDD